MMRPKTENSITDGSGNAQIGHNTGEINVGLTFEEHQQALNEALKAKTNDLERAHGAEKDLIRREADELRGRLADVEKDYHERLEELRELKAELAKYQNQFEKEKFDAANAALDRDDSRLAEALFKELLEASQARREDAERDEASLHYRLGKIAEDAVRWGDAYTHYKRATDLHETFDHLSAYARMTWRLAKGPEAIPLHEKLVNWAKSDHGVNSAEYANCLNNLAGVVQAQGRYAEAEELFREALEIGRATIGEGHPSYAIQLSNLAGVVQAQGRYAEAEGLFREALEIGRATIGEGHPDYANHLNNLALVVESQGRSAEAEALYREALEIDRATIGQAHPSYATRLNNLALVVQAQGRYEEAEGLYREALEIGRATLGKKHPDYATHLNNLAGVVRDQGRYAEAEGLYREALEIDRATVGEGHPNYATDLSNLAGVLVKQGKPDAARPLYEQALEIFRATLPPDHPHIGVVEGQIADLP